MTPLLLLAGDLPLIPSDNLGKALALALLIAMMLQPYLSRRGVKAVTQTQTAEIQAGTNEQTTLILTRLNTVRSEFEGLRLAVEGMDKATKADLEMHALRLAEYRLKTDRRLDGHDARIVDLHERVQTIERGCPLIEKGRPPRG